MNTESTDNKEMKPELDFRKFAEAMCEKSARLDVYTRIMKAFPNADVSCSPQFQSDFSYFYRLRGTTEWRRLYFGVFQRLRSVDGVSIADILRALVMPSERPRLYLSFSSKMLHTFRPDMPIWDSVVAGHFDLRNPSPQNSIEQRIDEAVHLYGELCERMTRLLNTEEAKLAVAQFDSFLPKYSWLTSTKKIDFILWQNRDTL